MQVILIYLIEGMRKPNDDVLVAPSGQREQAEGGMA